MKEHLPPLTADLVIASLHLEAQREVIGWHRCRDSLVGAMRHKLGHHLADLVAANATEEARNTSRMLLGELCRVCPYNDCKMKHW